MKTENLLKANAEWEIKMRKMCKMGITIPKNVKINHYRKYNLQLSDIKQTPKKTLLDEKFEQLYKILEQPLIQCDIIEF